MLYESVSAIITAGGGSRRMGGTDKIFAPLGGKPVLARVIETFVSCPVIDQIVIVLSLENLEKGRELIARHGWEKVAVCPGGARRQDSVAAGLNLVKRCGWVVVHDAARPLVTPELITRGLAAARETASAVAAVPITDTIKIAGQDMIVESTLPRDRLWAVQTPQVFRYEVIREAYNYMKDDVTDDAMLAERLGYKVKLFMGSYDNIKLTTPDDFILAETLLRKYER